MFKDKKNKELINPTVKEVLKALGIVGIISASFVLPGLPMALKPIIDAKKKAEIDKQTRIWKKYNPYILKQTLKRLQGQKVIEIIEQENEPIIKLTEKGKVKLLKYNLEELDIKKNWDGKWRLIIYDVETTKETQRNLFRRFLKKMKLYQLQKSVYLTPYECKDEIEYLRQYFGVGKEVIYLTVEKLENDIAYRKFFDI